MSFSLVPRLNVFKNADAVPPPQTREFLAKNIAWARQHSQAKWEELAEQREMGNVALEEMSDDEKYWRTVHVIMVWCARYLVQFGRICLSHARSIGYELYLCIMVTATCDLEYSSFSILISCALASLAF